MSTEAVSKVTRFLDIRDIMSLSIVCKIYRDVISTYIRSDPELLSKKLVVSIRNRNYREYVLSNRVYLVRTGRRKINYCVYKEGTSELTHRETIENGQLHIPEIEISGIGKLIGGIFEPSTFPIFYMVKESGKFIRITNRRSHIEIQYNNNISIIDWGVGYMFGLYTNNNTFVIVSISQDILYTTII